MDATELMTAGRAQLRGRLPPGGYDPAARLSVMDDEKIDVALLYPTIGITWEGMVENPELATAYSRAYNRWIVDFCSHDRKRLVPIAHICLKDPQGAVEEVKRARKDGCAGVYLSPDPAVARWAPVRRPRARPVLGDGAGPRHADRVPRRGAPQRARSTSTSGGEDTRSAGGEVVFAFTFLALDVMAAFTSMMTRGMFEKYPRLRCAVLEAGSNWITAWLDRMDHKTEVMHAVHADEAAALGVLQAPVPDLRRARRVDHRGGGPAPG